MKFKDILKKADKKTVENLYFDLWRKENEKEYCRDNPLRSFRTIYDAILSSETVDSGYAFCPSWYRKTPDANGEIITVLALFLVKLDEISRLRNYYGSEKMLLTLNNARSQCIPLSCAKELSENYSEIFNIPVLPLFHGLECIPWEALGSIETHIPTIYLDSANLLSASVLFEATRIGETKEEYNANALSFRKSTGDFEVKKIEYFAADRGDEGEIQEYRRCLQNLKYRCDAFEYLLRALYPDDFATMPSIALLWR